MLAGGLPFDAGPAVPRRPRPAPLRCSCRTSCVFSQGLRTAKGDLPAILGPVVTSGVKGVPLPLKVRREEGSRVEGGGKGAVVSCSSTKSFRGKAAMRGKDEVAKRSRNVRCKTGSVEVERQMVRRLHAKASMQDCGVVEGFKGQFKASAPCAARGMHCSADP